MFYFSCIFAANNQQSKIMELQENIEKWKTTQLDLWYNTRKEVEQDLSNTQPIFCCCGKLATGLHENHCKKFQQKVDKETINKLENEFDKYPE